MSAKPAFFVFFGICLLPLGINAQINLSRIADFTTPVPHAPGTTFREIGQPFLYNGQVLFYATNNAGMPGLYLYNGSMLVKIADTNTASPGGGTLRDISFYAYSLENGAAVFVASDNNGPAIFHWTNQTLTRLVKNGDPIPGAGTNRFNFFGLPALDQGVLYFLGGGADNYRGIHRLVNGVVSTGLVSSLELYPGTASPHGFSAQFTVESNRLAFWSLTTNQNAIFTWANGVKDFLVSSNHTIPSTSEKFSTFQSPPDLHLGLVAFKGGSAANFQEGIFLRRFDGGDIVPVVRRGDPHPGFSGSLTTFNEMAVDNGRVWFQAGGIGGQSLFLWQSNRYSRIISSGMRLDSTLTISSSASFTLNQNCGHQGLLTFVARFSNNSKALYLATETPPPPSRLALTNLVGTNTPIPGGSGNFTSADRPMFWSDGLAFIGNGAGGQFGVYLYRNGQFSVLLNTSLNFPGSTNTFAAFDLLAADTSRLVIRALGAGGEWGLFIHDGSSLTKVVDHNTPIPGGAFGNFTTAPRAQLVGPHLTFSASGTNNFTGIYEFNGNAINPLLDSTSFFPGTTQNLRILTFDRAGSLLSLIAYPGNNPSQMAVLLASNQVLSLIITNSATIPDRTNRVFASLNTVAFYGGDLYFSAQASGTGFSGNYLLKVPAGSLLPQTVLDETTLFPGIPGQASLSAFVVEPSGLYLNALNGSLVGLYRYTPGGLELLYLNTAPQAGAAILSISFNRGSLSTNGLAFGATTSLGPVLYYSPPASTAPAGGRFLPGSLAYSPGAGFCLTFADATPGANYRLQYRTLEHDALWITLTNFTYTAPYTYCDLTATNRARLYRVLTP
ncbi:MAG: hypothetical protein N3J91_06335 [Verrucomicrobiae bacterium]|nr:hypothetical protein [Verrucomicrobiae bacterium]